MSNEPYFGRDMLAQAGVTQGSSFAELQGVQFGRPCDRYRAPLDKSAAPLGGWTWWKWMLNAIAALGLWAVGYGAVFL